MKLFKDKWSRIVCVSNFTKVPGTTRPGTTGEFRNRERGRGQG